MSKNDKRTSILIATLAGTGAGFAEVLVMQPADVLKTRYQSLRVSPNYESIGLLRSFRKVIAYEGFLALYSGTLPVMCIVTPRVTVQYIGYATFLPIFNNMEGVLIPFGSSAALTGVCTGILQSITLVTPLELIKIRQQTDLKRIKYRGMISTVKSIISEEGILALYNGLLPTIFRQSWGLAVKFTGYTTFKDLFKNLNNGHSAPWQYALSGFSSNILVGILNSPPDVVKTRMQDLNAEYKNSWHCVKMMVKKEGFKSFFKGASLRCIRIAPGGAIQFSAYEYLDKIIRKNLKL